MNQLRKKVGPLPLYAWIIGGVVGLYLLTRGAASASPIASTNPAAAASGGDTSGAGAGISIPAIGSMGYGDMASQMYGGSFTSGLGDVNYSTDVGGSTYSPPQQNISGPVWTGFTNGQLPAGAQLAGVASGAPVIGASLSTPGYLGGGYQTSLGHVGGV